MAGEGTKRIIDLTEAATVQSGDFIAVDSNARGTKKVPTSALATSAALTAETNARAGADEAEAQAREAADNTLGAQIADLKSELSDIGVEENTTVVPAPRTVSKTINGSGSIVSAASNYNIYTASVTAGNTYFVSASGNWSAPLYAYYDSNMDLVQIGSTSASGSSATSINKEKTKAPTNASFLVSTSINEVIDNPILEVDGYVLPRLDAVVSDVNDLEGDVSDLMNGVTIRNLFSPSKVVSGYYFNGSGTLIANANSEYLDDYIPINPTETYIASADGLQICTYSSDKSFIERAYNQEDAETPMTFGNNVAFVRISCYGQSFPTDFIFATTKAYSIIKGAIVDSDHSGIATKTSTALTVTIGKLKVVINKYNDSAIRAYDLWRTNDAYIRKADGSFTRLWYNSDSDGVVKIKDEDDFIGGYHGDETQTSFRLFVDGVEYSESATFTDLEFDELILYCESDVYHCNTSATPDAVAFKRNKIITFNKDGYSVSNYWVAQEALTLIRAYMGMLSVERYTDNTYTDYLLTGYHTNHDYKYVNALTGASAQSDITEVVFNTIYGDVGIKISDVKSPSGYYADVTNYNSANDKRLKAYLAPINSNAGASVTSGAVIKAKATTFVR